jgi:enoyl-CoA hydratase
MAEPVLSIEKSEGIATLTLNRPEARNALNRALRDALREAFAALSGDASVGAVILTGAGPAFCAGLDLKELSQPGADRGGDRPQQTAHDVVRAIEAFDRPVIGAINGVAITGGFELALSCDFLVASDRARFADTHARVGIMPGWGLTVRLVQLIGPARAKELSVTGNFLDATTAHAWGLVNHVVPHDELLPFARSLASDSLTIDQAAVRRMIRTYDEVSATTSEQAWEIEGAVSDAWMRERFSAAELANRRNAIQERGRGQV